MNFICKDYVSALYSLSQVIGVSQDDIVSVLNYDWGTRYEKEYTDFINSDLPDEAFTDDFGEYILLNGFPKVKITDVRPTVHWFHGARAIDPDDYLNCGILPLSEMYPRIKTMVDTLAAEHNLKPKNSASDLKNHNKWLAEMKLDEPQIHGGPFAMLMYEAAALPKMFGNHSYIDEPEIISNYAYMMYDDSADALLAEYRRISYPIIVEFIEPSANDSIPMKLLISTVINYLYHAIHKDKMSINCNICFSNNGISIPSDLIVKVHRL